MAPFEGVSGASLAPLVPFGQDLGDPQRATKSFSDTPRAPLACTNAPTRLVYSGLPDMWVVSVAFLSDKHKS